MKIARNLANKIRFKLLKQIMVLKLEQIYFIKDKI